MIAGGFQKNSLIDFPGKISSVVFTKGCNFKCPYCHNPELISFEKDEFIVDTDEIFDFLKKRKGFIDAVVITGGEPCLQTDIIDFAKKIKNLGFLLKLDTNGSRPEVVEKLLKENLLDLIAMDIKTLFNNYDDLTNEKNMEEKLKTSVSLIMNSGVDYYFRTTCAPPFVTKKNFSEVIAQIKGAKKYVIQKFNNKKVLNPDFFQGIEAVSEKDFEQLQIKARHYFKKN
jgi:pyruvate formate lyase activating enzyme